MYSIRLVRVSMCTFPELDWANGATLPLVSTVISSISLLSTNVCHPWKRSLPRHVAFWHCLGPRIQSTEDPYQLVASQHYPDASLLPRGRSQVPSAKPTFNTAASTLFRNCRRYAFTRCAPTGRMARRRAKHVRL